MNSKNQNNHGSHTLLTQWELEYKDYENIGEKGLAVGIGGALSHLYYKKGLYEKSAEMAQKRADYYLQEEVFFLVTSVDIYSSYLKYWISHKS